ncbi:hypothetical protein GCM10008934_39480 [Virgibacillus salarius]
MKNNFFTQNTNNHVIPHITGSKTSTSSNKDKPKLVSVGMTALNVRLVQGLLGHTLVVLTISVG